MIVRAMSCLACAAAGICLPILLPILAQAEAQPDAGAFAVALEYSAAPGCPDVNDFKAIVVGRLGYDAFRGDERDRVLVDIASRGSAFEGHIERRNAEGRWAGDRTFPSRSNDCGELGRAMAFALALQIQFSARASAYQGANKTAVPTETGNTSDTSASPALLANRPTSNVQAAAPALTMEMTSPYRVPRPTLAIGASGLLGFGLSSRAVPFGRAFGSVGWQHSSLELAAEVAWPSTTQREDGAGFSQQLLIVGVAGCGDSKQWSACFLAKAGEIRIVGKDVDKPSSPSGPILEMGLRLAVMQTVGRRFYVSARAEGLVNVTRWRVTLDQNLVWTSPRFAATVGLDVGVRFPWDTSSQNAITHVAGGRDE